MAKLAFSEKLNRYGGTSPEFVGHFFEQADKLSTEPDTTLSLLFPDGNPAGLQNYYRRSLGEPDVTGFSDVRQTLELAFRDALPAPPRGTPFQEVLEFKARRKDQLNQLNIAIDGLALQLSGVPSLEDAVRFGKNHIEGALGELDKVFAERWSSRLLSTLRANLGSILTGAGMGALAAPTLELSALIGAGLGGLGKPVVQAAITSVVGPRKVSDKATPFLYAYQAQKELKPRGSSR